MKFSKENTNIIGAFVKAQANFKTPKKTKRNPFHKSTYADLNDVLDAIRPSLAEQGLAIFQEATTEYKQQTNPAYKHDWTPKTDKEMKGKQPPPSIFVGYMEIKTVLFHSSGESMEAEPFQMIVRDPSAQEIGKIQTYGKRYAISAFFGIASEDNDGNTIDQDGQGGQIVSESEKKALKKERGKFNQALLKCSDSASLNDVIDTFINKTVYAMEDKTHKNDFETFDSLSNEHRQRVEKVEKFNEKFAIMQIDTHQEMFSGLTSKCQDLESFAVIEEFFLEQKTLQTEENQKTITKLGVELGAENYTGEE